MVKLIKRIKNWIRSGKTIILSPPEESYNLILNKLSDKETFSFSRWGDGEWAAVLNIKSEKKTNCDGHHFFESMNNALAEIVLRNPPYLMGMQRYAYEVMGRKIDRFLKRKEVNRDWLNADAFHIASIQGKVGSFFETLAMRKVLLVGPQYLESLKEFKLYLIPIPTKNCWLHRDSILDEIHNQIREKKYNVILFCAGMPANWFVDQLHGSFDGAILDIGSLLDPYAGKPTRKYHSALLEKLNSAN